VSQLRYDCTKLQVECVRNWQSMKQTQVVNGILGVNGVFESDDAGRSCAGIDNGPGVQRRCDAGQRPRYLRPLFRGLTQNNRMIITGPVGCQLENLNGHGRELSFSWIFFLISYMIHHRF